MGAKNVYFDEESIEIIKKMNRGELSQICRTAVKDWEKSSEDLDFLKNKLKVLSYEKEKSENEFNILCERIEKIEFDSLVKNSKDIKDIFTKKVFELGINKVSEIEELYKKFSKENISLFYFIKNLKEAKENGINQD